MNDTDIKKNLLIVIDITEKENIILNDLGEVKEINGNGLLLIKNPSQRSRLWNIACDLKETVKTSIPSREIKLDTLDPTKESSTEYNISNLKQPLLDVSETFDTCSESSDKLNNTFLFAKENKSVLKISLKNPIDVPILNIKLEKELPSIFKKFEIKPPANGTASIKEGESSSSLSWEINSLGANGSADLIVDCSAVVNSTEVQSLGKIDVTYMCNDKILTMLDPEILAITDSMSGVTRDEGSQPGVWDCNVEFINESDFQVKLNEVKVEHKIITGKEVVVSQSPEKVLNRDQSWEYDFVIDSKEVPQLDPTLSFTTLFAVIKRVEGKITKEPLYYEVLHAEVEKIINPPEIGAYANTDISILIKIFNKGSAAINKLIISDEIKLDMEPPDRENIELVAKSVEGTQNVAGSENIKVMSITPNDKDLTKSHELNLNLQNMTKFLPANAILEITYPIIARNPKPDIKYEVPVIVKVNAKIEGTPYTIAPAETPEVKIKYIKRKFKTLKSIKPGGTEGEFIISIRLQNNGDVELENILLKDKVPSTFELSSFSPKELPYDLIKGESESELVIKIIEIKAGASVNIEYSCSGTGEYPRSEPKVVVKGRKNEEKKPSQGSAPVSIKEEIIADMAGLESLADDVKIKIDEEFRTINITVKPDMKSSQVAKMVEQAGVTISQICNLGPFLREINQLAKKYKDLGEKIIVGDLYDQLIHQLKEWKSKLF